MSPFSFLVFVSVSLVSRIPQVNEKSVPHLSLILLVDNVIGDSGALGVAKMIQQPHMEEVALRGGWKEMDSENERERERERVESLSPFPAAATE